MSDISSSSDKSKKQRTSSVSREDDEVLQRDPGYFQYYGQLQHQQNMLQDYVRTSTYHSAITLNGPALFQGRLVMDVGSGSGILTFFSVQAGAKHVYAVEASGMATKMRAMLDAAKRGARNAFLADRITVIGKKIEEPQVVQDVPQVDVIVSEPIGVLLVHERMLESYIYARDKFLRPGGAMLPSSGAIHLAPLSDAALWNETIAKARFWQQPAFYGVDLNPYFAPAFDEYFTAPVVGCFSPNSLMADSVQHHVDFHTVQLADLKAFSIPIEWRVRYTGLMHGVAGWFDLGFVPPASSLREGGGAPNASYMSTSPSSPATHWQQVRLLLKQPLAVNSGQVVRGWVEMKVNDQRSYNIEAKLICLDESETGDLACLMEKQPSRVRSANWYLHEQTYNYAYTGEAETMKPEAASLYLPVDSLLAESSENYPQLSSTSIQSVQGTSTNPTDFLVTTNNNEDAMQI
ncbi:hypothetical protein GGF46_004357 [Coemansia sp. RSA 552]|nr:hypothetical protein GGF46_004357 [Coemansia sp. RSA 552]